MNLNLKLFYLIINIWYHKNYKNKKTWTLEKLPLNYNFTETIAGFALKLNLELHLILIFPLFTRISSHHAFGFSKGSFMSNVSELI